MTLTCVRRRCGFAQTHGGQLRSLSAGMALKLDKTCQRVDPPYHCESQTSVEAGAQLTQPLLLLSIFTSFFIILLYRRVLARYAVPTATATGMTRLPACSAYGLTQRTDQHHRAPKKTFVRVGHTRIMFLLLVFFRTPAQNQSRRGCW